MKTIFRFLFFLLTIAIIASCSNASSENENFISKKYATPKLQNGDIIFQSSESGQSKAVSIATHSKYTHCGIVFVDKNKIVIYEAVQPVKVTVMDEWIKHGTGNKYIVKRLKNASTVLNATTISKMKSCAEKYKDKDIHFAGFAGLSYSTGFTKNDSVYINPFTQPGIYAQIEAVKKITYDVGIGAAFFADWNQTQAIFGARFIIYFSGAYKGKKFSDGKNID